LVINVTRRGFLKISGLSVAALASGLGFDLEAVAAQGYTLKIAGCTKIPSICHFCSGGCSLLLHVKDGKCIHLDGDPDCPINEGSLCPKAAGLAQVADSPERPKNPKYRAPGSDQWQDITWEEAIERIARKTKEVRDKTFKHTEERTTAAGLKETVAVNRTDGIAIMGGAEIDNEESYLLAKMGRLLGTTFHENQTRICHGSTVSALAPSFGRGAMTNSYQDMQNAESFLIGGSNCAEAHPIAMKWINRARAKGAKVIVVDPRFTRTASQADIFAQIRPGTDVAYLGAIINYIIEKKQYDEYYLLNHTNALLKVSKDFKFKEGLFSGYDADKKKYDFKSWSYQLDAENKPVKASSLDDPDTVFSKLREHYSRYTLETAEKISGIPAAKIKEIAKTLCIKRPCSVVYALGMTQHSTGVQGIRAYAVMQLLLGNIGKAGGAINALRGEPNVQGSTDMANLIDNLPGYIPQPTSSEATLLEFSAKYGTAQQRPIVALLKAWFAGHATAENDYCYDFIPKNNPANMPTYAQMFAKMGEQFKLCFNFGTDVLISQPDCTSVGLGLDSLEMLVNADIFENETALFWKRPGVNPKDIQTEVFLLPAAFVYEKAGTMANSGRYVQWKEAALKPPNQAKPDLDIIDLIFKKVRELYAGSTDPKDTPILKANWNYDHGHEASALKVLQELSGYDVTTGQLIPTIRDYLKAPIGTVSTGCWIYAGCTGNGNLCARRDNSDPSGLALFRNWSFAWPGNIRVLYNRASCDAYGQPLDPKRKLIWWDAAQGTWTGNDGADVVDLNKGPDTPEGQLAFRMNPEGIGRLFTAHYTSGVPATPPADGKPAIPTRMAGQCKDGPMPEMYEPTESPTGNILHSYVSQNPCAPVNSTKIGSPKDYPYVLTTYGVVEHFCSGTITRNMPWLNEIMPEPFAEISKNLGEKLGVKEGDKVEVSSARGKLVVTALVTDRIQTLKINGVDTETIGMPWSWGFASLSPGPSTNVVTMSSQDPTSGTPEYKCCLVNVRRA